MGREAASGIHSVRPATLINHVRLMTTINSFGMTTLLFTFIPLIGLFFSFTNTVGAALWAAEIEARANIIDPPADSKSSGSSVNPQPPTGRIREILQLRKMLRKTNDGLPGALCMDSSLCSWSL